MRGPHRATNSSDHSELPKHCIYSSPSNPGKRLLRCESEKEQLTALALTWASPPPTPLLGRPAHCPARHPPQVPRKPSSARERRALPGKKSMIYKEESHKNNLKNEKARKDDLINPKCCSQEQSLRTFSQLSSRKSNKSVIYPTGPQVFYLVILNNS